MTLVKDKKASSTEYQIFSKCFIEDISDVEIDYDSLFEKKSKESTYFNTKFQSGYNLIINRLDEIELLINTKVVHKTDLQKSKEEIILEQKKQIDESKQLIKRLLIVLNRKSTPNIFSIISLIGLLISSIFLLYSIFSNEIIFTQFHFIISTIGFLLMFIMARLSYKLLQNGNS